ncbi:MAG: hypothetical protein IH937_03370 [Acidobacteria bacterium]|nr:hypothetical protein [Acidobacteriota bacterium]
MSLSNYANLKAALRDKSHRNDMTDDRLNEFIDQAEADIWQRLRIRTMDTRATASSNATKYLALPTDFIRMRKLTVSSGGILYELEYRTPMGIQHDSASGIPQQFTVTSQLEFDRIPSTITVEMQYFAKLTALSDANTTNDVLTNFPNIYFYGALKHLYAWTDDEGQEARYDAKFEREIDQANKQDKRDGYGPAPAMRLTGTTP